MQGTSHSFAARRRAPRRRGFGSCAGLTVQVDGESIYYLTSGSVEAGEHTVVCLHGMGGSAKCWEDLLPILGANAYVIAVDLPGHGCSSGPGAPDVSAYSRFFGRFLDAAGIGQKVVLFGHCMGAAVALDYAGRHPERVAGLVLAGAGSRLSLAEGALEAARRGDPVAGLLGDFLAPDCSVEVERKVRGCWMSTRPEVRYLDLLATSQYDFTAAAARVRAPALLLAGAHDGVASAEAARQMAANWPATPVQVLNGSAHMPMLEQPGVVAQAVAGFLAGVRPLRPVVGPAW